MFKNGDKVKRKKIYMRSPFHPDGVYIIELLSKVSCKIRTVDGISLGSWDTNKFELAKPKGPYLSNQGDPINV